MSTVAHTILVVGPGQELRLPEPPKRRILVTITASYQIEHDGEADQVNGAIEDALERLAFQNTEEVLHITEGQEEPTARIEIHNIPEEPGT